MNVLFGKAGLSAILVVAGMVAGIFLQQKVLNPKIEIPTCPSCSCPEPTVSVQPFDVEKIKGIKSFNYSPQYTGNISVAGVDSASVRKWIEHSVVKAIEDHVKYIDKTKRK